MGSWILAAVGALALAYVLRTLWRGLNGKGSCNCGEGGSSLTCPHCRIKK